MTRRDFLGISAAAIAFPHLAYSVSPKPKLKIARLADDRFELVNEGGQNLRILQITDTHFDIPEKDYPRDDHPAKDDRTRKLIRRLVDEVQPGLVFHTGDFINNDMGGLKLSTIGFMNSLGTPWSLVFGNHDQKEKPSGITLETYYGHLENHATGFRKTASGREYCYRLDVRGPRKKVDFSLFCFNTGYGRPTFMSPAQREWLRAQLEADRTAGLNHPILVMQHIPTVEYKAVYAERAAIGRKGEEVCFEGDTGEVFAMYRDSKRVKAVFCGHDHVNDYVGTHQGVRLAYGRVTGWSGYGDWQRGGRVIDLKAASGMVSTRVVLPTGVQDKPEWRTTQVDS